MSENLELNVMMFGGRRAGKTSILASMAKCFNDVIKGSDLVAGPNDDDTLFTLDEAYGNIRDIYRRNITGKRFTPDETPSSEISEYKFYVRLRGKDADRIVINFIDYPGEFLKNKDRYKDIVDYFRRSDVLLLAIDSPYLMEYPGDNGVGMYNEEKNFCWRINELFKEHYLEAEDAKMICFVPLKCERYYHDDRMSELTGKVKTAYGDLISHAMSRETGIFMAVTPILTLGNMEFARFNEDDDGNVVMKDGLPSEPLYRLSREAKGPEPMFCEQPLIYTLAFLLKKAELVEKSRHDERNWFERLIQDIGVKFWNWPSYKDYKDSIRHLQERMNTREDGYEIIADRFSRR